MPWCPNCGYEYKHDVSRCLDCECLLSDAAPTAFQPANTAGLFGFAVISLVTPWLLWLLLGASLVTADKLRISPYIETAVLPVLAFAVIVITILYSRRRRLMPTTNALIAGWMSGNATQAMLAAMVDFLFSSRVEAYQIVFCFIGACLYSAIVMVSLWLSFRVAPHRVED